MCANNTRRVSADMQQGQQHRTDGRKRPLSTQHSAALNSQQNTGGTATAAMAQHYLMCLGDFLQRRRRQRLQARRHDDTTMKCPYAIKTPIYSTRHSECHDVDDARDAAVDTINRECGESGVRSFAAR